MRLDELVVEDFRKLQGRHVLRPAPLGITVVSGDNEEGKSTLLDALKTAFFMKHNTTGADRDAIQPFAGGETPAVTVGFTLAGHAYRLAKRFRRGGVQLETPEGLLEGDAAELRLASLLQFEWPGRGAARDTHTGVAGLFWVDQGTTFAKEQEPSPTALRGLQPALADQVAALGRGERAPRLMTEVRRRRDQHWTGKRDQPRGELATLEREVAELQSELARLVAEEAAVEALLDRLAVTLEKRRAWLAADHLGRARQAVEGTRSALARVKALEEEQRVRAAERQAAASELRRLQGMADLRGQRRAAIEERAAEQAKLAAAAAGNAPLLERARVLRGAADVAVDASRKAVAAAELERETLRRRAERLRLAGELAALERLAADVRATAAQAADQRARAEAEAITEGVLAELEAAEAGLRGDAGCPSRRGDAAGAAARAGGCAGAAG
ncbi:MAG: AAA family ATPase [Geminicoccaceae bacterium]